MKPILLFHFLGRKFVKSFHCLFSNKIFTPDLVSPYPRGSHPTPWDLILPLGPPYPRGSHHTPGDLILTPGIMIFTNLNLHDPRR